MRLLLRRLVCHLRGHYPSLRILDRGAITSASCTCLRCGDTVPAGLPTRRP